MWDRRVSSRPFTRSDRWSSSCLLRLSVGRAGGRRYDTISVLSLSQSASCESSIDFIGREEASSLYPSSQRDTDAALGPPICIRTFVEQDCPLSVFLCRSHPVSIVSSRCRMSEHFSRDIPSGRRTFISTLNPECPPFEPASSYHHIQAISPATLMPENVKNSLVIEPLLNGHSNKSPSNASSIRPVEPVTFSHSSTPHYMQESFPVDSSTINASHIQPAAKVNVDMSHSSIGRTDFIREQPIHTDEAHEHAEDDHHQTTQELE